MSPTAPAGLALVTGASSGIGRALARELVDHGYDLVVSAEDQRIHEVAPELGSGGRLVVPVQADLTVPREIEHLWDQATGLDRPVDVAVLNAGVGVGGPFASTELADHLRLVDLNVRSTVHLAKRVVDAMVARRQGRILLTSSIAAVMPGPFHATYAASKAFVHSFAESIRHELQDDGVTVTSLMPGPTDTEFFARAGMLDTALGRSRSKDDAATVARAGYAALMAGKPHVVPGSWRNRMMAELGTHLPDRLAAPAMAQQTKPRRSTGSQGPEGGA
ncbi:SDR family NAD(P)-dependent oxidoreductase [Nocardioides pantholopis]|uniref:SDR family NAD(P)-dependent oxidoreductase n=1 Tax=Nocardioides pantholopis TaxID=2483798 RepID=UPI000F089564|nr:SDR family NAD(P)-dependent oxidoreductase [Nocardioides pantholopis]